MRPRDVLVAQVCDLSCRRVRRVSEKRERLLTIPMILVKGNILDTRALLIRYTVKQSKNCYFK